MNMMKRIITGIVAVALLQGEAPLQALVDQEHGPRQSLGITGGSSREDSASRIRIHNTTNEKLACAVYYKNKAGAFKYGPTHKVYDVAPQQSAMILYPPKKTGYDIVLLIARETERLLLLQKMVNSADLGKLHAHRLNSLYSYEWYFTGHFDILFDIKAEDHMRVVAVGGGLLPRINRLVKGADQQEAELMEHFETQWDARHSRYMLDPSIEQARENYSLITHPDDLLMERTFVQERMPQVRKAINELFGYEILSESAEAPSIAVVATGGGYRSLVSMNGFLAGAAESEGGNLYDCLTYYMGCSGSAWAAAALTASGLTPEEQLLAHRNVLNRGGLNSLLSDLVNNSPSYIERRHIETRYGHYHGPIGLYGHALGRALLNNVRIGAKDAHHIAFSDLREKCACGHRPLPICVAVDPGTSDQNRLWYEFSPFYCGTHEGSCWIDTKLMGCTFKAGRPVHRAPEFPLAFLMGIWGSAFAVTPGDIAKENRLMSWIAWLLPSLGLGISNAYRFMLWGEPLEEAGTQRAVVKALPNFWYGASQLPKDLHQSRQLYLVDAAIIKEGGYRQNFAVIPALWRKVDLLIMFDNPIDPKTDQESKHLRAAEYEARRLGLPFPRISDKAKYGSTLKTMHSDVCSVFIEDSAPIVVYIKTKRNKLYDEELKTSHKDPRVRRNGFDPDATVSPFTDTSNMHYTPVQYDLLSGLTRSIMRQCKPAIRSAIRLAIERKRTKSF